MKAVIHFTSKEGYEAMITGDEPALRAIEDHLESCGVKYNEKTECWDEGYYEND